MGFNFGGFGDKIQGLVDTFKDGGVGELLQKLPLDQLPVDQLLEKLPLDQLLSGSFLQKFTPFESLTELLQSGGFSAGSAERACHENYLLQLTEGHAGQSGGVLFPAEVARLSP
ncbi:hypothetical protein [Paenibacillus phytohabitans]|uniref:hypothetical protein n=1 Tax=Paenibacillus phytohabitans TaxID=2654978 RepID=UPI0030094860